MRFGHMGGSFLNATIRRGDVGWGGAAGVLGAVG